MLIRYVTCSEDAIVSSQREALLGGYAASYSVSYFWATFKAAWESTGQFGVEVFSCATIHRFPPRLSFFFLFHPQQRSLLSPSQIQQVYTRLSELLARWIKRDLYKLSDRMIRSVKKFINENKDRVVGPTKMLDTLLDQVHALPSPFLSPSSFFHL
jgi:hypothetical protein